VRAAFKCHLQGFDFSLYSRLDNRNKGGGRGGEWPQIVSCLYLKSGGREGAGMRHGDVIEAVRSAYSSIVSASSDDWFFWMKDMMPR
jgi:hypothetical protein